MLLTLEKLQDELDLLLREAVLEQLQVSLKIRGLQLTLTKDTELLHQHVLCCRHRRVRCMAFLARRLLLLGSVDGAGAPRRRLSGDVSITEDRCGPDTALWNEARLAGMKPSCIAIRSEPQEVLTYNDDGSDLWRQRCAI
jgi:hypothetical protein